jgi:phospholipid/cholesterol/gamma-HCH transport system ATP-binding protein
MDDAPAVTVEGLTTQFGTQVIHDGLDLEVRRGEVLGVVGGSGSGKSVLLREIIGLQRPSAGRITLLGREVWSLSRNQRQDLATRTGVLFQDGALFSSLTVAENIQVAMREHLTLKPAFMDELAALKIAMVGLPPEAGAKRPAELSGGMRKRAGLARALALDPEILFLDEPTAGLDPIGAAAFDQLIRSLKHSLDLTVFMVTHDLDSLAAVCDRIAALVDKKVRVATMAEHMKDDHPWLKEYFHGPRARAVQAPARTEA